MEINVCGLEMPCNGNVVEYELNENGDKYKKLISFLRANPSLYSFGETEDIVNNKSKIRIWET